MSIYIKNGILIPFDDDLGVNENPGILIEDDIIKKIGGGEDLGSEVDETIDADKKVIMPGIINCHHHLYSAYARGLVLKSAPPKNFVDILEKFWWKLDKALTKEDIYYSALLGFIDCIKHGSTTIVDHHESQSQQIGSLDEIEKAALKTGIRSILCLGVSDRFDDSENGIKESERFIKKIYEKGSKTSEVEIEEDDLAAAMFGLHASFTVNDRTLERALETAKKYDIGFHIHCAEDRVDVDDSLKKYGVRVVERLDKMGVLGPRSIAAHCVHIDEKEIEIIKDSETNVVHNPQSNMNNAVGAAPVLSMLERGILVGLGTDGMTSNMFDELRVANILHSHVSADPSKGFSESCTMLFENNPKIIKKIISKELGTISEGTPADIIILDYDPPTPLNSNNFLGHILFGLANSTVDTTIVNGRLLMKGGKVLNIDEQSVVQKSRELAKKLWGKF